MSFNPPLPIAQTALLVVDVQDSFQATPERWASRNNPVFEANLSRLLAAFRAARRPVFFVLHSDSDPGFEPGGPLTRLMAFLNRWGDDVHDTEAITRTTEFALRGKLARIATVEEIVREVEAAVPARG